jgi:hypothetical protein
VKGSGNAVYPMGEASVGWADGPGSERRQTK